MSSCFGHQIIYFQCPADSVRRFYKSKLEMSSMKEKGKYDDKVRSQRRRNRVVKVCIEQISLGMSRLSGSVAYLCIYIYCICRCIGFYVNKCSHLCVAKPYWC